MADSGSSVPIITLRGAFSSIKGLNFSESKLKNGRDLIKDNLFNVEEKQGSNKSVISARILRTTNVNDTPYFVEFEVETTTRTVIKSMCTCVAGESADCKHGSALFTYINEERCEGKTDDMQVWLAPSKALFQRYPKGETTEQILGVGSKRPRRGPKRKTPSEGISVEVTTESDIYVQKEGRDAKCQKILSEMEMFGLTQSSLCKSLSVDVSNIPQYSDREPVQEVIPCKIRRIFYRGGFGRPYSIDPPPLMDEKSYLFYEQHICKSDGERFEIYKNTRGQSNITVRHKWLKARKNLVTASTAQRIARAKSEKKACEYFAGDVADNPNFRYGRETEPVARRHYSERESVVVHESGLVICRHLHWLGASPDGIMISKNGHLILLEIKCPVSGRVGPLNVDYLEKDRKKLKTTSDYYSQIQLQMLACDSYLTHLYIYGRHDQILVEVPRDDIYISKLILKLESVYFNTLLPALTNNT